MITFVLAEAEVELMPRELCRDPVVQARAKRRKRPAEQLLLDQAADHKAMRALDEADRRGRPDIAHFWTLLVMDSLVARHGHARVLVHTRHDELVRADPAWRVMRNQQKYYQLLEDLLRQGRVPESAPLLTVERGWPLARVLAEEARGAKVLLDETGERARSAEFERLARGGDVTLVAGGFPRGGFRQADRARFDHVLRVADEELTLWSAMVPVLSGFEDALTPASPR